MKLSTKEFDAMQRKWRKWYIKKVELKTFRKFGLVLQAFPDKEAAYRETLRVLKPGGTFCGCFYIRGGCKRTDWFIRHLYQPKGFFTPPYETGTSLRQRLSGLYRSVGVTSVEGMGCFCCVKEKERKGENG